MMRGVLTFLFLVPSGFSFVGVPFRRRPLVHRNPLRRCAATDAATSSSSSSSTWSGDIARADALHRLLCRLREDVPATPWNGVGESQSYADNFTFTSEKGELLAASGEEYAVLGERISQTLRASAVVADFADAFIDGVSGSAGGSSRSSSESDNGAARGSGRGGVQLKRCDMSVPKQALADACDGSRDEVVVAVAWGATLDLAPGGQRSRAALPAGLTNRSSLDIAAVSKLRLRYDSFEEDDEGYVAARPSTGVAVAVVPNRKIGRHCH